MPISVVILCLPGPAGSPVVVVVDKECILSLWSEGGIKTRSGASVQLNKTAALLSLNESSGRTRLSHIYFDQLRFSTKTERGDTSTLNSGPLCLDLVMSACWSPWSDLALVVPS